jgi:hypothetical protein
MEPEFMKKCAFLWMVFMILAFQVVSFTQAQADVVGRLTQVEGRVDILKGGQLPATPVKADDGVQIGDVLRTKSLSKALITFIDNSTLAIAPESRVGIEAYMFDPVQNRRNAVIDLFQGLAHVVVNKVLKAEEPDFVVKTPTAVMGVRGTDFGVRIRPNGSDVLNFEGVLQVGNIFPEVSQLLRRAFKVAYSFGPGTGGPHHWVFLKNMQGTSVGRGLPPTLPFSITSEDQKQFKNQLSYGLTMRKRDQGSGSTSGSGSASGSDSGKGGGSGTGGGGLTSAAAEFTTSSGGAGSGLPTSAATTTSSVPVVAPTGLITGTGNVTVTTLNTVTVPPTVVPVAPAPEPSPSPNLPATFRFSQTFTGPYQLTSTSPFTVAVFTNTGPGSGTRTGVYPGSFTASYSFSAQWVNSSMTWAASYLGSFQATMSGQVTGFLGQVLSGTMSSIFTDPVAGQFTLSGPVTISPAGTLTGSFTGTGVAYPALDQITITSGTISQTPTITQATTLILSPTATPQVAATVRLAISPPVTQRITDAVTARVALADRPAVR